MGCGGCFDVVFVYCVVILPHFFFFIAFARCVTARASLMKFCCNQDAGEHVPDAHGARRFVL